MVELSFDCCETPEETATFEKLEFDVPLQNVLSHNDDLKFAGHKIEEIQKLIDDQEWKLNHNEKTNNLSFLSYIGMATMFVLAVLTCCSCCKPCRNICPWLTKWCKDHGSCTHVITKIKVNNKVHSSQEELPSPPLRRSTRSLNMLKDRDDAIDETELVVLNRPVKTGKHPANKR